MAHLSPVMGTVAGGMVVYSILVVGDLQMQVSVCVGWRGLQRRIADDVISLFSLFRNGRACARPFCFHPQSGPPRAVDINSPAVGPRCLPVLKLASRKGGCGCAELPTSMLG